MKKLVLLLTVTLTAIPAFANLGDTYQQSCVRYGKPFAHDNNSYAFELDHTITVQEWINPVSQKVEMISYSKSGSKFSEAEYARVCGYNLPDYLKPDRQWNIGPKEKYNDKEWRTVESKDGNYWIQWGTKYETNPYRTSIVIGFSSSRNQGTTEWHYLHSIGK